MGIVLRPCRAVRRCSSAFLAGSLLALLAPAAPALTPAGARHGMVVSSSAIASQAGCDVLRRGGNAVDAAVAVGFALAVTHPAAGNLGGGGFMLIRLADGRCEALDYRETAPRAATRDLYLDAAGQVIPGASTRGPRSAGVPGRSGISGQCSRATTSRAPATFTAYAHAFASSRTLPGHG